MFLIVKLGTKILKTFLAAILCSTLLALPSVARDAVDGTQRLKVVELFTSQACNSCPPADALLTELSTRPGILVLSWSVDYWDYLGWRDTLAKPEHSDRQRAYNKRFGRRGVFTPQMVISGRMPMVGSERETVEANLAKDEAATDKLDITLSDGMVRIALPSDPTVTDAIVLLVHYARSRRVPIHTGENSGKTITYSHVVIKTDNLGNWSGEEVELAFASDRLCNEGNAILVHDGEGGAILRAGTIENSF